MADMRFSVRAVMVALVDGFGCLDAVAETLAARWGAGVSKGTLSKKMGGQLDWTLADVIAIEDAARNYPVTRLLARRLARAEASPVAGNLVSGGAGIAKEAGEAVSAVLTLSALASAGEGARAEALREVRELIMAARAVERRLEFGGQD